MPDPRKPIEGDRYTVDEETWIVVRNRADLPYWKDHERAWAVPDPSSPCPPGEKYANNSGGAKRNGSGLILIPERCAKVTPVFDELGMEVCP